MKLDRILPFARQLLTKAVDKGDLVIDATVGNGHDTIFLAELVGDDGHVYGFDIQQQAIEHTTKRLAEQHITNVTLFCASHDEIQIDKTISAAIFNLGYLPGSDKTIVTKPETTISTIEKLLLLLKKEGIIVLVVYHGHQEGKIERDALLHYVTNLDQSVVHVLKYEFINQKKDPPFIIAIEKR